jgi:hypothetical protein
MRKRLSLLAALVGLLLTLPGCGDSKPKADPGAPPPKGGPKQNQSPKAPSLPSPPP